MAAMHAPRESVVASTERSPDQKVDPRKDTKRERGKAAPRKGKAEIVAQADHA
jgi:hypothetical protein